MRKLGKVLSYILAALIGGVIALGAVVMLLPSEDRSKLDELSNLIDEMFIGQADQAVLEDAAADAMVSALGDRWSHYLTAEEYAAYKEQMANSYVGIGVTVHQREDGKGLDVTQVTAGGGADQAGMKVGDRIVGVDGKNIEDLPLNDVKNMIRGEANTVVELTVLRDGSEMTFRVTRMQVQTPVATATLLPGGIGLVKIVNFDSRCAKETIAAIEKMRSEGATKLIFDVRFNPGGYKTELVEVLDYLLPEGLLFRSEYYDGSVSDDHSDKDCLEMPMVVLVNGDSYSAAEFFAAALRDYEWGKIVGTQTCGKGYFQNTFELSDGSAVALSIGKYFTPKGVSLAEVGGLTPDKIVEVDEQTALGIYAGTIDPMEDPQIQAAIAVLNP